MKKRKKIINRYNLNCPENQFCHVFKKKCIERSIKELMCVNSEKRSEACIEKFKNNKSFNHDY